MPLSVSNPFLNNKLKGWKGGALALLLLLLSFFEGNKLVAYRDIAGVLTICQGITQGVYAGEVVTQSQCDQMNGPRAQQSLDTVDRVMTAKQPEVRRSAIASFAYNIGDQGLRQSMVARKINAGDIAGGCAAMRLYVCYFVGTRKGEMTKGKPCYTAFYADPKPHGGDRAVSKGLTIRRSIESELCLKGDS